MNLDQAPPPDDLAKGWKPDPLGSGRYRYWNGSGWEAQVVARPPGPEKPGAWAKAKGWSKPQKLAAGCGAFFLLAVIAAAFSEDPDPAKKETPTKVAAAPSETKTAAQPKPVKELAPAPDPETDIAAVLEDVSGSVQTPKVKRVLLHGKDLKVDVETPEGGFDGPSIRDIDEQAGAIFRAVYLDTAHRGPTAINFSGGLVDTKTGAEMPNANTGSYEISGRDAKRVNWEDEDLIRYTIDWGLYRLYASPALKQ